MAGKPKVLRVQIVRVIERTHEEAFTEVTLVRGGKAGASKTTAVTPARKLGCVEQEFEWDAPVVFNLEEGELPEELLLSVRGRLGHSGTPEVLGAGTLNLREVLASGQQRQEVKLPLSRHHKRNMEAEAVITEHSADIEVLIELE